MKKFLTIIQARSGSTRFPGKYKHRIGSIKSLDLVLLQCLPVSPVVFVVPEDDQIIKSAVQVLQDQYGCGIIEGPENNLVKRYDNAVQYFQPKWFARITGDCPLLSTITLLGMFHLARKENLDFLTNTPNCVDGSDVQICSLKAWPWFVKHSETKSEKEHLFSCLNTKLHEFDKIFKYAKLVDPFNNCKFFPKLSLDTEEDILNIRKHYQKLKEES